MRKIIAILTAVLIGCGVNCFAQGKVSNKKNTATTQSSKPRVKSKQTPKLEGELNGHEWVDLGLPSGTKWAVYNLGANKYEIKGDYFCWGTTHPKEPYAWQIINYIDDISGKEDYDAATVIWGKGWVIPTKFDCLELINECKISGDTINEVRGVRFTGPNGKSIFLPAYYIGTYMTDPSDSYWTSTPIGSKKAYGFIINASGRARNPDDHLKEGGLFIRPIIRKSK